MAGDVDGVRAATPEDTARIAHLTNEAFVVGSGRRLEADGVDITGRFVLAADDRVDATAWAMDVPQWMYGRSVPARAVAGVAVASDRRGTGAGRRLMSEVLRRSAADGAALMTLYPSLLGFYRRQGFEIAG